MDPISLAIGAVGLGMQVFGGLSGASNASAQAAVSQNIAVQEQGINNAKQQAMEIQSRRTNMQSIRNGQVARATAEAGATSQGAQFGSGLQGGLAQVTDSTLTNLQGVNQAVQTGQQINAYDNSISTDKEQLAALGGQAATDQAITSMGGAMMKAGPTIGNMSQGLGNLFGSSGGSGGTGLSLTNTGGLY